MARPIPDPNELWVRFVTAPVGSLSTPEILRESSLCSDWIKYLRDRSKKLSSTRAIKIFQGLGWASQVVSLPAIFAEPLTGFTIWILGATATTGAHVLAKKKSGELTKIELLISLYLTRQRQIAVELRQRSTN